MSAWRDANVKAGTLLAAVFLLAAAALAALVLWDVIR